MANQQMPLSVVTRSNLWDKPAGMGSVGDGSGSRASILFQSVGHWRECVAVVRLELDRSGRYGEFDAQLLGELEDSQDQGLLTF